MPASDRQPSRPGSEAATLTERAAMLVEQDILAGHLAPGSRLGIVDLVQRYEIGATPLREGLSRLMSRGLIVGIGQRGRRRDPQQRTGRPRRRWPRCCGPRR